MLLALAVLLTIAEAPFGSSVDQALSLAQSHNWNGAMAALNRALNEDPAAFDANNLHYLRGRVAEEQGDWARASEEFDRIGSKNPLRPLASWHGVRSAVRLGAIGRAEQLVDQLPADFPSAMRVQLVRDAPPALALRIVNGMNTRPARLQRALLLSDAASLWALVRENNADDVAVESARHLAPLALTPRDVKDLASAFFAQRQFDQASAGYERLAQDPEYAAEAQYQLGRVRFMKEDYSGAIDRYTAVATIFKGTDWQKNAEYQIATSYWRLRQYKDAEKAFVQYIDRYGSNGKREDAIRDLVDVYRSLGEHAKALALIDRTLKGKVSVATRQVLIFTKAKTLFSQEQYSAALQVVRQLKGARLQSTPGGTATDEILYFEALCLSKMGNTDAARAAWQKVAADPESYYGRRAAGQLGVVAPLAEGAAACSEQTDSVLQRTKARLIERRRSQLPEGTESSDALTELLFLQLWDEAAVWVDQARRPDPALAADLGYVSERYARAILYADRLGASAPDAPSLRYPAGFRASICKAAAKYGVDPLWLHAIIWQESKYDPAASSAASARGLMQFIPDTAEAIAAKAGIGKIPLEKLYDADTSIELGAYYWSTLLADFKRPELALAAYNGGPDNVRRWRDKWPGSEEEFFISDIGFTETKRYVQAVFNARAAYGRLH